MAAANGGEPDPGVGSAHRSALLFGRCWTAADLAPLPGETDVLAVNRARDAPHPSCRRMRQPDRPPIPPRLRPTSAGCVLPRATDPWR